MEQPTPSNHERSPLTAPGQGKLSVWRFYRLALKELREILRDRRTIITLVLMPVLVYPLLSLIMQRFLLNSPSLRPATEQAAEPKFIFGFDDRPQSQLFDRYYRLALQLEHESRQHRESGSNKNSGEAETESELNNHTFPDITIRELATEGVPPALEELVAENQIDLGIRVKQPSSFAETPGIEAGVEFELIYLNGSIISERALSDLQQRLQTVNQIEMQRRLERARIPAEPLVLQHAKAIEAKRDEPLSITTLIPLILTLMTITGAVYPAIDLTAGERERGTMETLIATPVPRMGILLGKFVAVLSVALLTALVNMIGMTITIWAFRLDKLLFGDQGISFLVILEIMGLVALFAGFFSSVLLAITSFARSFKEAQAYLIPVMLISLTPGLLSLMPDLKLEGPLVVLPLINIVLLARDILQGESSLPVALITITSTFIYGFVALTFAARIFGTDAILFGNQNGWRSFFQTPRVQQSASSLPGAFFCLALLFPANFVWLGLISRLDSPQIKLLVMSIGTVLMFAAFPLAYAAWKRVRFNSGLGLRAGRSISYPAAILLGCSLGVLLIQIYSSFDMISEFFVSSPKHAEQKKQLVQTAEQTVAAWKTIPTPLLLVALSVVPAFCEELFFRGLFFRSLLKATSVVNAVIISGVMFGLFHILSGNLLALERFFPTALMGMVLAIVCYKSQSVIPSMILHTLHNLILVSTALFHEWFIQHDWMTPEQTSLPFLLVVAAVLLSVVGFLMLFVGSPAESTESD